VAVPDVVTPDLDIRDALDLKHVGEFPTELMLLLDAVAVDILVGAGQLDILASVLTACLTSPCSSVSTAFNASAPG